MSDSVYVSNLPTQRSDISLVSRHSLVVRLAHWVHAASFLALVLSGIAILLAYPRMHWGETGTVGAPALFDLPLPFVLDLGIRGPGRYLHFLAASITLFTGSLYIISGLLTRHFRRDLIPRRSDIGLRPIMTVALNHLPFERLSEEEAEAYNVLQRLSYLAVVFVLLPFMFLTGFAMSPAITSVFPVIVHVFGGHQSARTLHFVAAVVLVLFLFVHITMVTLAGFVKRCRAMITGYTTARKSSHD